MLQSTIGIQRVWCVQHMRCRGEGIWFRLSSSPTCFEMTDDSCRVINTLISYHQMTEELLWPLIYLTKKSLLRWDIAANNRLLSAPDSRICVSISNLIRLLRDCALLHLIFCQWQDWKCLEVIEFAKSPTSWDPLNSEAPSLWPKKGLVATSSLVAQLHHLSCLCSGILRRQRKEWGFSENQSTENISDFWFLSCDRASSTRPD